MFSVKVNIDGNYAGDIHLVGNTVGYETDYLNLERPLTGSHTIEYVWTNDHVDPSLGEGGNIQVREFLFK
jgi:hypothetical protein